MVDVRRAVLRKGGATEVTAVTVRPLAGAGDIEAVQRLASRLWPSGWHPGGLGWSLVRGELADEVVVAADPGGEIVGWAGRGGHGRGELHAQVDRARPDVASVLVNWMVSPRPPATRLTIPVWDGAPELTAAVAAAGLVPAGRGPWAGMFRAVEDAAGDARREVPGYTCRPVAASEQSARVAVHRNAWRPASMPYADGRVVDTAAESSFTAEVYDAVRSVWLYNPEFDLVAVDANGEFGGCCIAWFDPATGVAEIEPMGVAPDHRRRGLAVALCLEVAARVQAYGGTHVYLNTTPVPGSPAAYAAYMKAGFRPTERATTYVTE